MEDNSRACHTSRRRASYNSLDFNGSAVWLFIDTSGKQSSGYIDSLACFPRTRSMIVRPIVRLELFLNNPTDPGLR
jgi:hypothetical protein